ncbi:MAG: SRPBCC family protein [Armatimonadota bacterium]
MFEREIEEAVEIVASPSEVWWQLTNFAAYPEWNPFITRIEGDLRECARLTVTLQPRSMPSFVIRPRLIRVEPERELRWRGRLGLPGVFDGEHAFIIESTGVDRLRFTQREHFSGLLAFGALGLIEGRLRASFQQMNEKLRQRSEAAHATREAARAQRQARQ